MNEFLTIFILLSVPGLPLLLAFPVVHSHLSKPCLIALIPAIILVTIPIVFSFDMPWLLFHSGLGIDPLSRLFLAMSLIVWLAASIRLYSSSGQTKNSRFRSFFLLTMALNFAVILSTDLVSFFTFSSLMGYGFYVLLVDGADNTARRAGRLYLGLIILADLFLFEALLITALVIEDLSFNTLQHSPSSTLYLSLVLLGFAAKAGIWPLHFWLAPAFYSSRSVVALLLSAVPIAMSLLGTLHWLPIGYISSPDLGFIVQLLGVSAMLYAIIFGLIRAQLKTFPAYVLFFLSGLYTVALGAGLSNPVFWQKYETIFQFFIILLAISLSVLVIISRWLASQYGDKQQTDYPVLWIEHLFSTIKHCLWTIGAVYLAQIYAVWLNKTKALWQPQFWCRILDKSEHFLQIWSIAISLFLLLGITVALISALSWG